MLVLADARPAALLATGHGPLPPAAIATPPAAIAMCVPPTAIHVSAYCSYSYATRN
jgi:hypothetical protein